MPAVLVENRGNKAITILLGRRENEREVNCSRATIAPARVERFRTCGTQMYLRRHDGTAVQTYELTENYYAIFWDNDRRAWNLKPVSDRE